MKESSIKFLLLNKAGPAGKGEKTAVKNQWTTFYTGNVEVRASGEQVETFVNELVRRNIYIWNVRRINEEQLAFYISLGDIAKLRTILRKHSCKIHFSKRNGLPFLFKRLLGNAGFLAGFFLFLVCLLLLSNVVWNIEVTGANPEMEYKIRKELKRQGVEIGKFQIFIKGSDDIQRELTDRIEALTWVGVELKGTTYHLQVVEKKEPKRPNAIKRQHLVAGKKAVIKRVFVEKGKAVVEKNDYVQKGQILVSGNISNGEKAVLIPAKGEVLGEVWYKSEVKIPLKSTFDVLSGKEKVKHHLQAAGFNLPIWGFGKVDYKEAAEDRTIKPLYFLGWKLPVTYEYVTYRDKETVIREYSKQEAFKKGEEVSRNDLKKLVPKGSEVIGQKILHESLENGKVVLSIHYQVIENIAIEQPIIQGD